MKWISLVKLCFCISLVTSSRVSYKTLMHVNVPEKGYEGRQMFALPSLAFVIILHEVDIQPCYMT